MEDKEWMTVDDVAKLLEVHPQSIRRWIKSGELIASQLGAKAGYRIRNADLEAFMKQRQTHSITSEE